MTTVDIVSRRLRRSFRVALERNGHQRLRATQMAIVAIEVFVRDSGFLVGRGLAERLKRLALVFVRVVPEVADDDTLFVLAVRRGDTPDKLERQQREHQNDEVPSQ